MSQIASRKKKIEFGDFQTPPNLAIKVCSLLKSLRVRPSSVIEPTCGKGAFLIAAKETFNTIKKVQGSELNPEYIKIAHKQLKVGRGKEIPRQTIREEDFFSVDWRERVRGDGSTLVVGNPPWVTNSGIGAIGGSNLPKKTNIRGLKGMEAITGKSNFDISEWMLSELSKAMNGTNSVLAMLCKVSVARKVLTANWTDNFATKKTQIYRIDAMKDFGAAVDACLMVIWFKKNSRSSVCEVFPSLSEKKMTDTWGMRDGTLVANAQLYDKHQSLLTNQPSRFQWRSGIKHDCSRVMEFSQKEDGLLNGLAEKVEIEKTYCFPLLKSSDLQKSANPVPRKSVLVTQKAIGDDTAEIAHVAPKTWVYLQNHRKALEKRGSSIYKNKPPYSIFGVGPYSFAKWKIAISGFYKSLEFKLVGPNVDKPTMLDDTCYFLSFNTKREATIIYSLLKTERAREFISAYIFWDEKRPITVGLLCRLNLEKLAELEGITIPKSKSRNRKTIQLELPLSA